MKTFAEYLPTMTAREREIVEAYSVARERWKNRGDPFHLHPCEIMRATPPAKEPVSAPGMVETTDHLNACAWVSLISSGQFNPGDRVRVTKLETT